MGSDKKQTENSDIRQKARTKEEVASIVRDLAKKYRIPKVVLEARLTSYVAEPYYQREIDVYEVERRLRELAEPESQRTAAKQQQSEAATQTGKVPASAQQRLVNAPIAPSPPNEGQESRSAEKSKASVKTESATDMGGPEPQVARHAEVRGTSDEATEVAMDESRGPAPAPIAPEWKVLEPKDRTEPVDHEVCKSVDRDEHWKIVAGSVRGKLHAHKALWRDDAFAFDWTDDWTILAVSDGAGSARISRVGARIACDEAVETLKTLLTNFRPSSADPDSPSEPDLMRIRTFLVEAARKAQAGILREAKARSCSHKDLYATLLVMVHRPLDRQHLVAAIQVGDGAVGIFSGDGNCTLMGVADHGEYSSETRFLTTPYIEHEFEQRVTFSIKKDIRCLAAMCDGVSDDFFPEGERLVELFVGDPIKELKQKSGEPVRGVMRSVLKEADKANALVEWLKYEKKGSSDDRTLLLMYRNDLL